MSGFDAPTVTSAALNLIDPSQQLQGQAGHAATRVQSQDAFSRFLRLARSADDRTYLYRDQLAANYRQGSYYLTVDMEHLEQYEDSVLYNMLTNRPSEYLPVFENAAKEVVTQILSLNPTIEPIFDLQILLTNFRAVVPDIRELSAKHVSKLVTVKGIVVSAGHPRVKATKLSIMCRNCKLTKTLSVGSGFGGVNLPRECDTKPIAGSDMVKCPLDPFVILADSTECIDQQRLKLQEHPESVPTGELPRNISLALERQLVGQVKPGSRVTCVGMYTTYEAASRGETQKTGTSDVGIRIPYLRVFSITHDSSVNEVLLDRFTPEEEEQLKSLPQTEGPNLYKKIVASMCPAIFENDDIRHIKAALACQLFGGTPRFLPDKLRLRGDINILLLGDPSVAKSQFLKFMHQVAPIGVYTSGKGSSAAGLTASVIRDPSSGEFHLEGGALVLADGGLVCIDEFDKMREEDRVAIHEAMEQQTISIAKAGITTQLNSRASVLAAANPVFGRYDDMKSPTENIDFQTSILSRFDMIFIVRDIQDATRDQSLAKHVLNVHRNKDAALKEIQKATGLLDTGLLKKYVAYARSRVRPTLNETAQRELRNYYVLTRSKIANAGVGNAAGTAIPITVRQLEAVIRISEARARIDLQETVNESHVREAIRLFEVSTLRAATASFNDSGVLSNQFDTLVKHAESLLPDRIAIGSYIQLATLRKHLKDRGCADQAINMAIGNWIKKGSLQERNQGKMLYRTR